jgi:hypothetical protein
MVVVLITGSGSVGVVAGGMVTTPGSPDLLCEAASPDSGTKANIEEGLFGETSKSPELLDRLFLPEAPSSSSSGLLGLCAPDRARVMTLDSGS